MNQTISMLLTGAFFASLALFALTGKDFFFALCFALLFILLPFTMLAE